MGDRFSWVLLPAIVLACAHATIAADAEEAQYNVVVALYNAGQWQAAVAKIEEREKLTLPDAMRARYTYAKALAYDKGGKTAEAAAAYQQLIAKYPQAAEAQAARLALVYADYAAGNYDRALATGGAIDQGRLSAADKKNLAVMTAESLYHKKQDAQALAAYQNALTLGADAASLAPKMFDLRLRSGMHAEVLAQSAQGVPGVAPDMLALVRAEALLALGRQVEVECQKVPAASALYPRACLTRAQALVKQGKLKEAAEPLEIAVTKLKDPPAPTASHLALVECLLELGNDPKVAQALARAEASVAALPQAQQPPLAKQLALLRLRAAGQNPQQITAALAQSRPHLTPDQLAKALYARLFALAENKDHQAIVKTMAVDYPPLRGSSQYGPAALIYYQALHAGKRDDEGLKLLAELVQAVPSSAEAAKARLVLGQAAASKGNHAEARAHFEAALAAPDAQNLLGKEAWVETIYNRAIALDKLGDHAQAVQALRSVLAASPSPDVARESLVLLGQACAAMKDYPGAIAAWKDALAKGAAEREVDVRDRLARVMVATGDHAGVVEQVAAAGKLAGGEHKLARESREILARSLFALGKFAEAAAAYEQLARQFAAEPALAYECAVALERAGKPDEALNWYQKATRAKQKLPPEYATAAEARLAALELERGTGDLGLAYWLKQAAAPEPAATEPALEALRKVAAAGKFDHSARERLKKLTDAAPADKSQRYALGGILLAAVRAQKNAGEDSLALAGKLARQLAENEGKLDPKSSGATVGAAMIYFHLGEAQRAAGHYPEALASYETVLAAYPYNHWPDAAACGAAECFLALGDTATAETKFKEVAEGTADDPQAARWKELARKRLQQLASGK